jgi:hypothetical protein
VNAVENMFKEIFLFNLPQDVKFILPPSINQRHLLQQKRSVHVLANSLSDFVIKAYFIQQNH